MFDLNNLFFLFLILCAAGADWRSACLATQTGCFGLDRFLVRFNHYYERPGPAFRTAWQLGLWNIWSLGPLVLRMDRLSALFVFVTGLVYLPVSIYSARYMMTSI